VVAETFGKVFKIYSTKQCPTLKASTALTKVRLSDIRLSDVADKASSI
jgi:hypothetical protein